MKKFLVSTVGCLLAIATYAQSTCETRVDAHQRATTKQRVAYCLTPDAVAADDSYSGLVFSGVSTARPQATQPTQQERPTSKPGRFEPENITVSRSYVATAQFPQATQANAGQAVDGTSVTISTGSRNTKPTVVGIDEDAQLVVLRPVEHFMIEEVGVHGYSSQPIFTETKVGVKARQMKPNRRPEQIALVEEQPKSSEQSEQTVQVAQPVLIEQPVQTGQTVQSTDATNLYIEQTDVAQPDILPAPVNSYNPYEEIPAGSSKQIPVSSN